MWGTQEGWKHTEKKLPFPLDNVRRGGSGLRAKCQGKIFSTFFLVGLRMSHPLCYSIRMMTEEQKREQQRKVERRVQRWKESVEAVKQLVKEWKKKNKR